jgi:hypothetical protein
MSTTDRRPSRTIRVLLRRLESARNRAHGVWLKIMAAQCSSALRVLMNLHYGTTENPPVHLKRKYSQSSLNHGSTVVTSYGYEFTVPAFLWYFIPMLLLKAGTVLLCALEGQP